MEENFKQKCYMIVFGYLKNNMETCERWDTLEAERMIR